MSKKFDNISVIFFGIIPIVGGALVFRFWLLYGSIEQMVVRLALLSVFFLSCAGVSKTHNHIMNIHHPRKHLTRLVITLLCLCILICWVAGSVIAYHGLQTLWPEKPLIGLLVAVFFVGIPLAFTKWIFWDKFDSD